MSRGRDSRRRLLDAAAEEFAAYGIAGARVDRISANAQVNKAQIYSFFGSKGGLFNAVFTQHATKIIDGVPMSAADLPGYAASLYDAYLAHPALVRLAAWARLELVPVGELVTDLASVTTRKLRSIATAQDRGQIDPSFDPVDVLALVTSMALTWSPASLSYTATEGDPDADHDRRRTALAEVVRRAFAPQ